MCVYVVYAYVRPVLCVCCGVGACATHLKRSLLVNVVAGEMFVSLWQNGLVNVDQMRNRVRVHPDSIFLDIRTARNNTEKPNESDASTAAIPTYTIYTQNDTTN